MIKIGDFSKIGRVTVKALRHYDEIGLLKPVQVDEFTGYRYYAVEQLTRLSRIIALKEMGLSLDEVARLLRDDVSIAHILDLVHIKQAEIKHKLSEEADRLTRVEEWLKQVEKEGTMPDYQITIKKVEPMVVASIRDTLSNYGAVGPLYGEIFKYLGKKFVFKPAGPLMMICHDKEYKESDVDVEAIVPIGKKIAGSERVKVYELAGMEQAACTVHKGSYETISKAYEALMAWIESNGYQIIGPDRELYFTDPSKVKPEDNVTEIQFQVTKAK